VQADRLWRESPGRLGERPFAVGPVARWHERREAATGDRARGRAASGGTRRCSASSRRRCGSARSTRRGGAAGLARYRSGQQAGALKALADARRTLVDELGVEPGQALRDLELQVLRQDPAPRGPAGPPALAATASRPALPLHGAHRRRWSGAMPRCPPCCRCWRRHDVLPGSAWSRASPASARPAGGGAGRGRLRPGVPGPLGAQPRVRGRAGLLAVAAGAAGAAGRRRRPGRAGPGRAARRPRPDASPTGLFSAMDAVASALRRAAEQRPVVVLLDDLQWADPASLQLLGFLATHLGEDAVLVVGTVREGRAAGGRADHRPGRRRAPAGQPPAAARGPGRGRPRRPRPADDAGPGRRHGPCAASRRAEGNPFFTAQLAQLLLDGDDPALPCRRPSATSCASAWPACPRAPASCCSCAR
jgi:hypothetical protein